MKTQCPLCGATFSINDMYGHVCYQPYQNNLPGTPINHITSVFPVNDSNSWQCPGCHTYYHKSWLACKCAVKI